MFGQDPMMMMQQRQDAIRQASYQQAQLDPFQRASASMYQGGAGLVDAGMMAAGIKPAGQQLAETRQAALANLDQSDPESFKSVAAMLAQGGDTQGAQQIASAGIAANKSLIDDKFKEAQTAKALREPLGATKTVEGGVEGQPDMRQKLEQLDDGTWSPVGTPYKVGGTSGRVAADAQQFLTAEAVQQAGSDFRRTGKLPPNLTKADKSRILNSAADEAKQAGKTGEAESLNRLAIRTQESAAKSALGAIEKRSAGIEVGAAKIVNDIKTMQDMEKTGSLDIPQIASRPLNWARTQLGSPNLRAYALSTKQVATEYMRMMTGGMLSVAQLHPGAQDEAKNILNENMTIAETRAIIPVMLREIENARQGSAATKQGLIDNIQKIGVQPKAKEQSASGWSATIVK
jgi:hypothetical protein